MLRITFSLLLSMVWTLSCFSAPTQTNLFRMEEGFQVEVPVGWHPISNEVLGLVSQSAGIGESYEYGFYCNGDASSLTYPYVLIQVKKTGRVPESQFSDLPEVKSQLEDGANTASERIDILSNIEIGKTYYDPKSNSLWFRFEIDVKNVGQVKALGASLLTQQGVINVFGYSEDFDFDEQQKVFESIIRSVNIDASLRYKSQISDSIPFLRNINWMKIVGSAVGGAIAMGIISLFLLVMNGILNRNANNDPATKWTSNLRSFRLLRKSDPKADETPNQIDKLRKIVRLAGTWSLYFGYLKIVLVIPVIWLVVKLSKEFGMSLDPKLPETLLGGIADIIFTILTAIPMVVYGKRIRCELNTKTKTYVTRLIWLAIALFFWDISITYLIESRMKHYIYLLIYIAVLYNGLRSLRKIHAIRE